MTVPRSISEYMDELELRQPMPARWVTHGIAGFSRPGHSWGDWERAKKLREKKQERRQRRVDLGLVDANDAEEDDDLEAEAELDSSVIFPRKYRCRCVQLCEEKQTRPRAVELSCRAVELWKIQTFKICNLFQLREVFLFLLLCVVSCEGVPWLLAGWQAI